MVEPVDHSAPCLNTDEDHLRWKAANDYAWEGMAEQRAYLQAALRLVDDSIAEITRLRGALAEERDEVSGYQDWSNDLTEHVPEHFEDDIAQEAVIARWLADLVDAARRVLADPANPIALACLRYCVEHEVDDATAESAWEWKVERNRVANDVC